MASFQQVTTQVYLMCLLFHLNDLFDPVACLLRIKGNSSHLQTSRCQYLMIGVVNVVKAHFLEN